MGAPGACRAQCERCKPAARAPVPNRHPRAIVPSPPGGMLDLVMRIIAEDLQVALGQPIVIESKAGGAGILFGSAKCSTSSPARRPHDRHPHQRHRVGNSPHCESAAIRPVQGYHADELTSRAAARAFVGVRLAKTARVDALTEAVSYVKRQTRGKVEPTRPIRKERPRTAPGIQLNQTAGLYMVYVADKGSSPALART